MVYHFYNSNVLNILSVEEEGWVYKCPLYPCEWTCGKEDMRKGPAVLHLLKIHKIPPLEMREKGIKFDKMKV